MTDTVGGVKEGHNKVPAVFLVLFFGLIAWGVWYIISFTPFFSGWTQQKVYEEKLSAIAAAKKLVPYENPYEQELKAVEEGRGLYSANCAVCHGEDLKGGVGPDLTGRFSYGETDKDKYISIFEGRAGGMPPFGDQLGRDRVWKVLAYMDSVREYGEKP